MFGWWSWDYKWQGWNNGEFKRTEWSDIVINQLRYSAFEVILTELIDEIPMLCAQPVHLQKDWKVTFLALIDSEHYYQLKKMFDIGEALPIVLVNHTETAHGTAICPAFPTEERAACTIELEGTGMLIKQARC